MNKPLWLGIWRTLLRVPRPIWQNQIRQNAQRTSKHALSFMSQDHHRVRNFVVTELPRVAHPISSAYIAERLDLPIEGVTKILIDLEQHMTFLFRNPQGEVSWAYPVTSQPTPHRVSFSSGEQIYAA